MKRTKARPAAGFTLVEILIVVVIIVVLIAILVPVFSKVRDRARAAATASLINNICSALDAYRSDLGMYPSTNYSFSTGFHGPGRWGMNVLAQSLVGYRDDDGQGPMGPYGFRMWQTGIDPDVAGQVPVSDRARLYSGRVYGPYLQPRPSTYATLFFNSPYTSENPGTLGMNQAFIDAWGRPIFYWSAAQNVTRWSVLFGSNWVNSPTSPGAFQIFNSLSNPDCNVDGVTSRLPAFSMGAWNSSTSPLGVVISYEGRAYAWNTRPGLKFRAMIGQSNPTSDTPVWGDQIVGMRTFLLCSAGPDGQYYTGDEIVNEFSK